uniref:PDZ domain-containing protein n=2 Tax=Aegilops tauschii subsp. strangulata TaxID=200361 RepID=A0A453RET8_AEGTS
WRTRYDLLPPRNPCPHRLDPVSTVMAPTTQEDVSGSSSRAGRRRRRRTPVSDRSAEAQPEAAPTSQRAAPTTQDEVSGSRSRAGHRRRIPVSDRSAEAQPEAAPSSQRGKRKASPERSSAASQRRRRKAPLEPSEDKRQKRTAKKRKRTDEKKAASSKGEEAAATTSASPGASHASSSSEASSAASSPLRCPLPPAPAMGAGRNYDPAMEPAYEAYMDLSSKYHAKRKRQLQLVTLDRSKASSCMVNEKLQSVRESATKTVLQVAKVVLGFSSYVDGKLMARSSGFLIDWDERSKAGTVLTSARIICSKYSALSQWSGTDEYAPNAEIVAHLLDEDDATVPALLLHYDKHVNIALIKVEIELCAKIPSFSGDVIYGQEIFVLGRDEHQNLTIHHGRVQFMGPNKFQRHHYLFSGCVINQPSIGGPVIDLNGQVWGMANFPGTAFIPSSIILKCLDMWKKYQCIPRMHIGMKLSPIKFLDPIHVERIFRRCNVDSGLIVHEVSHGSVADELGVRPGDIIDSVNGEHIATTIELENLLMRICESHLDEGGVIGSCVDIPINCNCQGLVQMQ